MAGINKVIIIGNLGQDPEVRYTPQGTAVANFSLATSESFTDKAGEKQERTEWHRIVAFNKLAELCGEYLHKGRQAYVEGRLQTRSWDDKEGHKRYTTEIVAQTVQFLGNRGDRPASNEGRAEGHSEPTRPAANNGMNAGSTAASRPAAAKQSTTNEKSFDYGPPPMSDDDIPF